ncbi:MAG: hypothetical protein HY652_09500 [Acidobacteria bacterium]|nr:hypothetical protein [Acidobacteriota bacterium]
MARKPEKIEEGKMEQQKRMKLSAKEALRRMRAFGKRREKFIAAIREGKD